MHMVYRLLRANNLLPRRYSVLGVFELNFIVFATLVDQCSIGYWTFSKHLSITEKVLGVAPRTGTLFREKMHRAPHVTGRKVVDPGKASHAVVLLTQLRYHSIGPDVIHMLKQSTHPF